MNDDCAACDHALSDHPPEIGPVGLPFHTCRFVALAGCSCPGYVAPGEPQTAALEQLARVSLTAIKQHRASLVLTTVAHSQDWSAVHPALREWLMPACDETGAYLVSGHRTWAQQDYLYQGWLARRPGFNAANPPGLSNHEAEPGPGDDVTPDAALACDIGGNISALVQHPLYQEHGHRPVTREDWHIQDRRTPTGQWQGWGDMGPPTPSEEDELMAAADDITAHFDQHLAALANDLRTYITANVNAAVSHLDKHLEAMVALRALSPKDTAERGRLEAILAEEFDPTEALQALKK